MLSLLLSPPWPALKFPHLTELFIYIFSHWSIVIPSAITGSPVLHAKCRPLPGLFGTAGGRDPNPCHHLGPSSQNLRVIPGISLSYTHSDSTGLKHDGSVGNWSHIAVDFTAWYVSNVFFYIHQALVNSLLNGSSATSCCHSSSVIKLLSWNHLVALQILQKCEQYSFEHFQCDPLPPPQTLVEWSCLQVSDCHCLPPLFSPLLPTWPSALSAGFSSIQFSSVARSCPTLCNPMNLLV